MTPTRLFRDRMGLALAISLATLAALWTATGTLIGRGDAAELSQFGIPGTQIAGLAMLAVSVWQLARQRRSPPPSVRSARGRMWALLAAAAVVAAGPSAGIAARVAVHVTEIGIDETVASTCVPQNAVHEEEGELTAALASRRLYIALPESVCSQVDPDPESPWLYRSTRHHDNAGRPSTLAASAWSVRLEPTENYLRALFLRARHPSSQSPLPAFHELYLRALYQCVAVAFLVFAFPFSRRRRLRPETDLRRIRDLVVVATVSLVLGASLGPESAELRAGDGDVALAAVVFVLLAGVWASLRRNRFNHALHVLWPALVFCILMSCGARVDPSDTLHQLVAVVGLLVCVPLYTAINERIRVLPE